MGRPRFRELAEALRVELRRRRGDGELSVSELARRACMTQGHVSNIVAGRRRFSMETADAVMLALGITTEELLEYAMDAEGRRA